MPSEKLEEVDVVILADVPEITPEQAKRFSRHVKQGNGLVWFPGDNLKTAVWNDRVAREGISLLPAVLGQPKNTGTDTGTQTFTLPTVILTTTETFTLPSATHTTTDTFTLPTAIWPLNFQLYNCYVNEVII